MDDGSTIGVPGPVATMRPPCTWRLSTAVGGRYNPTVVRSSPASGVISTRSPTTISRLSSMGGNLAARLGRRQGDEPRPHRRVHVAMRHARARQLVAPLGEPAQLLAAL